MATLGETGRGRWPALSHGPGHAHRRPMTSCHPILWEEAASAELLPQQQMFFCAPGEMVIPWDVRFWAGPLLAHP